MLALAAVLGVSALPDAPVEAAGLSAGSPRVLPVTAADRSVSVRELAAAGSSPAAGAAMPRSPLRVVADGERPAVEDEPDEPVSPAGAIDAAAPVRLPAGPVPSTFEGLSSGDNERVVGYRVSPADPVGDVGPNHYVQMVNLVLAVYSKSGERILGPLGLDRLWEGFGVEECREPNGDPVVLYDGQHDRWILTQMGLGGFGDNAICLAVSATGDPTGGYYRYAFSTGANFPDYPKYGVWNDTLVVTTREFPLDGGEGVGVYALELDRMLAGRTRVRGVGWYLDATNPALTPLVGDGLLPADVDGTRQPVAGRAIPLVGTQDDGAGLGATIDALNVWELSVSWSGSVRPSLRLAAQLPVAPFDSMFPCSPGPRDCLAQPGLSRDRYLDIQSYRQRPLWRLAYRRFSGYDSMVTTQSVQARPGIAGLRWYEIRRGPGGYRVHQQGTYAPFDATHRWMGSIAQDRAGNAALGFSVVNGVDTYPGIRYVARLAGDPPGTLPQRERTIVHGTGVQRSLSSRWGDYTSMNVDPVDDCTFWYVNQYYTAGGQRASAAGWQTRIASFRLPGC